MDEQQRELERLAASGDDEALLQLLVQRVRSGELSEQRWLLAGYLGHPGACQVQGIPAFHTRSIRRLKRWFKGIAAYGREASVRAALALPSPTVRLRSARSLAALHALEDWVLDPQLGPVGDLPSFRAHKADDAPYQLARAVAQAGYPAGLFTRGAERTLADAVGAAVKILGPEVCVDRIQAEVIPWALGLGDPVRDRVAERGQIGILPEELAE